MFSQVSRLFHQAMTPPEFSEVNIDSRITLPLEIFMGVSTFVWGLAALLRGGSLSSILYANGLAAEWFYVLGVTGFLQAVIAGFILTRRRSNDRAYIYKSASLRMMAALMSFFGWASVGATLVHLHGITTFVSLMIHLGLYLWANVVVFSLNWQIRMVLDARIPTKNLQSRLAARH